MQRATERNTTRKLSRLCKKHRNCAAGNARPTRIRRPTGARPFRHKRTCHEAQYPGGGQRGFFAPDVAALNTVPDAGSTVHVEGEVPRMPPWGSPGLASP